MDHLVYLDFKAKELENIKSGKKTMIIRGATGRKLPHGRVEAGDVLYFAENNGSGIVKGKATVENAFSSEKLTPEASVQMVEDNQDKLMLNAAMKNRFGGKRYLVLIGIKDFQEIEPFKIDRSGYKNMDDWLPVEAIDTVRLR